MATVKVGRRGHTHTLMDIRGSVRVNKVQDFDAIREQVKTERARKIRSNELGSDDA